MTPSSDRYWRVYLWIGLVLLALGLAFGGAYLIYSPPRGDTWFSALTHYDWSQLGLCLVLGLMSIGVLTWAYQGHKREGLRARTIAGDERAMRLAPIKAQGGAIAELDGPPLSLLWLPERQSWAIVGGMIFLALMLTGAVVAVLVAIFLDSAALVIGCGVVVAALETAGGVWLRARRRTEATGVIATGEGLRAIRAGKERACIPWGEARLLEVWRANNQMGFALASARALAEWRDYPMGEGPDAADGVSREEMYLRAQALLCTVIARTGLEPRTFERIDAFSDESELPAANQARSWPATLAGAVFLLAIEALLLMTAASALLIPLTHSLALNLYIAVTMGGLGLAPLVWLGWWLVGLLRGRAIATPVERPAIHLPDAPQMGATPLRMRVLSVWRDNAITLGVLALVAIEGYALVRVFSDTVLPQHALPWWDPRMLSVEALGLTTFLAGAIAITALFSRTPVGVVEERGLRLERGAKRALIPWEMLAELVITVGRGANADVTYKVIAGDSQRTALIWPARVGLEGVTLTPGESPGAVFAAAIAQRAGLTPRVVYM